MALSSTSYPHIDPCIRYGPYGPSMALIVTDSPRTGPRMASFGRYWPLIGPKLDSNWTPIGPQLAADLAPIGPRLAPIGPSFFLAFT